MNPRVVFSCPGCASLLRASARFAGRPFSCPRCGQENTVPFQTSDEEAPLLIAENGTSPPAVRQAAGRPVSRTPGTSLPSQARPELAGGAGSGAQDPVEK